MSWRSGRVLLAGCLVLAAVLLMADMRGSGPAALLRSAASTVTAPAMKAMAWARTEVADRVGAPADAQEVAALEEQLRQARADAAAAAAGQLDEQRARELAAALPVTGYAQIPGRVVALSWPQDQVRSASVSAGSASGVAVGQAVCASGGLAGLVDSAGRGVATLRLLVDPSMALSVRVAGSGEAGLLRGTGDGLELEPLDPLAAMNPEDLVVTIGTPDGVVPADLPVGRVSAVSGSAANLTRRATVRPLVDDSTLDHVVVLVPESAS